MRPALILTATLALLVPTAVSAQAAAPTGLRPADVAAWITSKGGEVGPVQSGDGQTWFDVKDGPLIWSVFFYACTPGGGCGDLQFHADFSNPSITEALVSRWNRERRFLKAVWVPDGPGGQPMAQVQYDPVLRLNEGVDQLTGAAGMWVDQIDDFATFVGFFRPEGETAPTKGN